MTPFASSTALLLALFPAVQGQVSEARIEALCSAEIEGGRVPAISLAIARDGELVYEGGFGLADIENRVAASADTVYRIGSVTKEFTAAAVMRLVEQERLELDDPLTDYVDVFDPGERVVTVRHLLNHTGGFKNVTDLRVFRENVERKLEPHQVLAYLADEEFLFEPGSRFAYNNGGYLILGLLVEELAQTDWESFVDRSFLEPLGLETLQLEVQRRLVPHRARGYGYNTRGIHNADLNSMTQPFAAGAMISNARDLVHWKQALLDGRVVSAASLEAMTTPVALPDGETAPYGFGLELGPIHGHRAISHSGGIVGFSAYLGAVPEEGLVLAVLCNQQSFGVSIFARRLFAALLFPDVVEQPMTAEELQPLAGSYASGELEARVRVGGKGLRISGRRIDAAEWLHVGGLEFRAVDDLSRVLRFTAAEGGAAGRLELQVEGSQRVLELQ